MSAQHVVRNYLMESTAKNANLDLNLSQRLNRALTAGKGDLYQALDDPSKDVVRAALRNPALDENHLLDLLRRRDLSEELLRAVCRLDAFADSHRLKVAAAHNTCLPGNILSSLLPHLYLFELVSICSLPGATPDQKLAAERSIIQRLPTTPLGNKISLARRGTTALAEALVREGDPRLMDACLGNPHLKESAIHAFICGPNTSPETISVVARHPRWKNRINLQLAMLSNPKTPGVWFSLFLPHLKLHDLKSLKVSTRLIPSQKKLVIDELKRRGYTIS
jgi:hypothetical protein